MALIEPETYVPVLPVILVNGSEGIGTDELLNVPYYNPADIIENLRLKLEGKEQTTASLV